MPGQLSRLSADAGLGPIGPKRPSGPIQLNMHFDKYCDRIPGILARSRLEASQIIRGLKRRRRGHDRLSPELKRAVSFPWQQSELRGAELVRPHITGKKVRRAVVSQFRIATIKGLSGHQRRRSLRTGSGDAVRRLGALRTGLGATLDAFGSARGYEVMPPRIADYPF